MCVAKAKACLIRKYLSVWALGLPHILWSKMPTAAGTKDSVLFLCTSETVGCKTAGGTACVQALTCRISLMCPSSLFCASSSNKPSTVWKEVRRFRVKIFVQEQAGLWPLTFSGLLLLCFIFPDTKTKVSERKQPGRTLESSGQKPLA